MTQTLSSLGSGAPEAAGLNETQLLDAYRTMRTIREFEDGCTRVRHRRDPGLRAPLCRRGGLAAGVWPTSTEHDYSPAPTGATATASPRAARSRR